MQRHMKQAVKERHGIDMTYYVHDASQQDGATAARPIIDTQLLELDPFSLDDNTAAAAPSATGATNKCAETHVARLSEERLLVSRTTEEH